MHVYETDLMGIVHHSNYLRYCEEARVDWCKNRGFNFQEVEKQNSAVFSLSVYETKVKHIKPLKYADTLDIEIQVKIEGIRLIFQYKLKNQEGLVCVAETVHCNLDQNLKVKRLSQDLIKLVENEKWIETWL